MSEYTCQTGILSSIEATQCVKNLKQQGNGNYKPTFGYEEIIIIMPIR